MRKSYIGLLFLTFVLATTSIPVGASLTDLKRKQATVQEKAKQAKDLLADTKLEKSKTTSEVLALDAALDEVTHDYEIVVDELEETNLKLEEAKASLALAEEKYIDQYETFKKRIRFMHESGTLGYVEILLSSKNIADLLNNVEYINTIVEYDNNLAKSLNETKIAMESYVEEISFRQKEVVLLASKLEAKKLALEESVAAKEAIVYQLTLSEQQYLEQAKDLEASSLSIEKMIKEESAKLAAAEAAKRQSASTERFNGVLQWPVPGSANVTSPYGNRKHPINGRYEMHTGIDIAAPTGTNVVASEKGTVIASSYQSSYGNTVVIDHGGGLSTLYAHNSKLLVSKGQTVSKGQIIAKIGSTGYSTGPHLHFEVRINGAHTTPKNYLKY